MELANRLLGYPDDARLLIVNADDLGMCRGVNEAVVRAVEAGVVRSTSLMVPWPAAAHAMDLLGRRPDVSFGVHLTVICDMPGYRWGPLSRPETVPSLVDEAGRFLHLDQRAELLDRARLDELEQEFRAQIEAVLTAGLAPAHLDWHCLHDGGRPDIFELTLELAREYGLAVRASNLQAIERLRREGLPSDDHDLLDSYGIDPAGKPAHYVRLLRDLPAGLSEWAVHPGLGDDELRSIEPTSWRVRQTDFEFLVSDEAREVVRQEGIVLLGYRALQPVWRTVA